MLAIVIERHAMRVGPRFAVSFQRTLRIPDDGRTYPLPPGLGVFPIHRVERYSSRLPARWREEGGVFIPMRQREAMWLGFRGAAWKPNAVKIAVGRINAVSGAPETPGLHDDPQDYIVVPLQPWLDGINTGHGSIRQFVAMPLGLGYTVEASLADHERAGGIQITVFEPKPGVFPDVAPPDAETGPRKSSGLGAMGLGAGGVMKQKIYADPHGLSVWDQRNHARLTVHILNSAQYREVTGQDPPATPVDAATYARHELPWFDLYDERGEDVAPSQRLTQAKTISQRDAERGVQDDQPSFEVPETRIRTIGEQKSSEPRASIPREQSLPEGDDARAGDPQIPPAERKRPCPE